ncbi:protein yellow-like isoform X2 [Zootermopsis nevadensis]|uniref:Protein yellow n=2 Tax=Zootermopsis nevadensis TaxID=136037 RepID=A0A067RTY0_ZOONE|nr:protein yellow-like isoform X2 [Zootermopsis nevadensis]KDR24270.1 Protein yellow [Zootermopsis nevadensis]
MSAAFFLPLIVSLSMASPPNHQVGTTYYRESPASASKENSRLQELYLWKTVDFKYPSDARRQEAIRSGSFKPQNNVPLGLEVWKNRIFVTFPKWRDGIPVTLATIPRDSSLTGGNRSPPFKPYPNWSWYANNNCYGMTSVLRVSVDPCGRLWVLDSGVTDIAKTTSQTCPPQLLAFDLNTDEMILRYRIPDSQAKQNSLFTNIVVDVRQGKCDKAYVYMTDSWRFGLVVYSLQEDRSWRIDHHLFYPDPIASSYTLHGVNWRWTDGIFGIALSPVDHEADDRTLLYHPMSSFREFAVPVSYIRNKTLADSNPAAFQPLGEPRATKNGHSSAQAMDRQGILFFNLVTQDSVGCWNSQQPYGYRPELLGIVGKDSVRLNFPNDLKIDHELRQSVWILSNKLSQYLYSQLDFDDYNFRILTAPTDVAVQGTVCDPNSVTVPHSYPKEQDKSGLGCQAT